MKKGFTLVELSIVLVIVGLLIGGILVARSMIGTTKIMATVKSVTEYHVLMSQFKGTYKFYAGDLPGAYDYFGASCGPNLVKAGIPFQEGGCNGDGNGFISTANPANGDNSFLHLSMSKILPKEFVNFQQDLKYVIGRNVPAGEFPGTFYRVTEANDGTGYIAPYAIYLWAINSSTPNSFSPAITPADTLAIDQKLDDGLANAGMVRVSLWHGNSSGCASGATYMAATESNVCTPAFIVPREFR